MVCCVGCVVIICGAQVWLFLIELSGLQREVGP